MLSRHEAHTQTHSESGSLSLPRTQTTPGTVSAILRMLRKESATVWACQPALPYTAIFVDINCVSHMELNSVFQLLFPVSSFSFSLPPPWVWEAVLLATAEAHT